MMNRRGRLCALLVFGVWVTAVTGCSSSTPEPSGPVDAQSQKEPEVLTLRLASGVWPPFTENEGKMRLAMDLVHEALRRAQVDFQSRIVGPEELIPAIKDGSAQGSEGLWLSPDRQEFMLYSEPYLENRLILLGRSGTDVSAEKLTDLRGKKLGVVRGYAYGEEIDKLEGVELVWGDTDPDNLRALLRKEIDFILVDALLGYYLHEYYPEKSEQLISVGTKPLIRRSLHFAIRKDVPNAQEIISRFNQEIAFMRVDGSYHAMLHIRWATVDVDGDGVAEHVPAKNATGAAPPEFVYQVSSSPAPIAPKYHVEGASYGSWNDIPEEHRVNHDDNLPEFRPAIGAVLLEF